MQCFPRGPASVWGSEGASLGQCGSTELCGRAERFPRGGNSAVEGPVVGKEVSLEPRGGQHVGRGRLPVGGSGRSSQLGERLAVVEKEMKESDCVPGL